MTGHRPRGPLRHRFPAMLAYASIIFIVWTSAIRWMPAAANAVRLEDLLLERQALTASDATTGDAFGVSIAISGDTALVGAMQDDVGANADQGSAYIFVRSGDRWIEQAKLTANDGMAGDRFGQRVALMGGVAVVGAPRAEAARGSAYVFTGSGTSWVQQAKLLASDGLAGDLFGTGVALSGNTIVVGALRETAAYVFVGSNATWLEQAKLTTDATFGLEGVAISGDTILLGVPLEEVGPNNDQGSAYVYVRSGTVWTRQAKLIASDGGVEDVFGGRVALSGDTALIGALFDDIGASVDQGSAYVFVRSGTTWTEQAKLTASDGEAGDTFGWDVALSADIALVGAERDDIGADTNQGSAYIFRQSGSSWTEQRKLTARDGEPWDGFGFSVALGADLALIAAPARFFLGRPGSVLAFYPRAVDGDFDRDHRTDLTVWRPGTGVWWTLQSSGNYTTFVGRSWGVSTDVPVPGDYDGDRRTDPAVWRPGTGVWYALLSGSNYATFLAQSWGVSTDVPVPGDYDGDGRTDPAVWRPETGVWYALRSSSNYTTFLAQSWGVGAGPYPDVPVPGDYDGDGRTDPAVWRPETGVWYALRSGSNYTTFLAQQWGVGAPLYSDVPVPGDYDGDGRTDPAVWRPETGVWYVLRSSSNYTTFFAQSWGVGSDLPVPGDYDGDERTDPAVWRPGTGVWYALRSSSNYTTFLAQPWGLGVPPFNDVPIP